MIKRVLCVVSAPEAPAAEHLLKVNSTSIQIKVSSWKDSGCPISSLVLEYRPVGETGWTLVSNNVQVDKVGLTAIKVVLTSGPGQAVWETYFI